MRNNIAERIVEYHTLWNGLNKSVIAENIENYLYMKYPVCMKSSEIKVKKLEEITGAKEHTVYAWLNRSRKDVKVPFLKLCMIAISLNVNLADLLIGRKK